MNEKTIIDHTADSLRSSLVALGMPSYSASQVMRWVYGKGAVSFDEMSDISKKNISLLKEHYRLGRYPYTLSTLSADGTKKYLFAASGGNIETVAIPESNRLTLCVSCQVGCKMSCAFCMTGKCGFAGNLTCGDIINQVLSVDEANHITNIVFMGMGEPFDNIGEVLRAIDILTSDWGLALSPRRITVSTSGLIDGTRRFLDSSQCHLAISLHNPFHDERRKIMPVEDTNPIADLVTLLRRYDFAHQRRLSFEYILFDGLNDTPRHAAGIVQLLRELPCRVNLIRFHRVEGSDFASPPEERIEEFARYLSHRGIIATVRRSRGEDIAAACGQLKNSLRLNR